MDNNNNLVSVIVPVYNTEKYLEKCINSILSQTYSNIEIIMVDDGSTDKSASIIDKYLKIDKRIKLISKSNSGVSSARNRGLEAAKGEYICFADSDDYMMNNYVEYLLKLIKENDADISLTTQMYGNFNSYQTKTEKIKIIDGEVATENILCYNIPIGVYSKMFRSYILKDTKFIEDIYIGEGFNFNTTVFQKANKIAVSNMKIYYYRRDNSNSATTNFSVAKAKNSLYAIQTIKKNQIIMSQGVKKAWEFAYWRTKTDIYDMMILSGNIDEYQEIYYTIIEKIRSGFILSLNVRISFNQRLRAFIFLIMPKAVPYMMLLRNKIYGIHIGKSKIN